MRVYWIKFVPSGVSALNLGMGVTARDEADATHLVRFVVGDRQIVSIVAVEDIETLDGGHVRPNMGNIFVRGVWWPRGYEDIASRAPGAGCLIPFHAVIDVGDPGGVHKRATLLALDLADAEARFEAEFGTGAVVSLWVDDAYQRPRG